MVELMCGLHQISSGGDQRKIRDGGASVWASPCEFRGATIGVPKW